MHIFSTRSRCAVLEKGFSSCCVHENIFDFHLCRGKLNSQTIIDWRCRNMFNPPITDRKALPQKKITSWRFAIEIFVTFAFWDFRNFWLCSPCNVQKCLPEDEAYWIERKWTLSRNVRNAKHPKKFFNSIKFSVSVQRFGRNSSRKRRKHYCRWFSRHGTIFPRSGWVCE